jgi:general secretion pathway protein G
MKNALSSERGFTLVELMVVLIILMVVMTFFATKLLGAGDKAKADLTRIMMKEVQNSIEQYRLRYNSMPSALDDLTRCTEATGPGCIPVTSPETLKDAWGNAFSYTLENGGRSYRLKTFGRDGRDGGEGVDFDFVLTGP